MSVYKSTYYQVLGIEPGVSLQEIKRAYRSLVKSYHPDIGHKKSTAAQNLKAHQRMAKLNEAYEILKDKNKRAAYDASIGLAGKKLSIIATDGEQIRQQYLNQTFRPAREKINRMLSRYKKQLTNLAQDIFNEDLVADLEHYANEFESILSAASQSMSKHKAPLSLSPAELMLRYAIAQAADALDELHYFSRNYDYNHLATAGIIFRESHRLSKEAASLCKS